MKPRLEYPDSALGRAASWMDTMGEEHAHMGSLDPEEMRENKAAAARLFAGTALEIDEVQEVGGMMGAGAAYDVLVVGAVSATNLAAMFQGVFVAGAALGARVQAGLHS